MAVHTSPTISISVTRGTKRIFAGWRGSWRPTTSVRPRGFPEGLPFVWDAATLANGTTFTLTTDLGIIDLLAEVSGIGTYADPRSASEGLLEAAQDD